MTDWRAGLTSTRHRTPLGVLPAGGHPRDPRAHNEPPGHVEPRRTISTPTETLLRGLLAANGRRDADARVVEGVRAFAGAGWAALVEHRNTGWYCRNTSGRAPAAGSRWEERPSAGSGDFAVVLHGPNETSAALSVPLEVTSAPTMLLLGPPADRPAYDERTEREIRALAADLALALRKGDEIDTLRSQAFVDALTECYNRRGFDEHLNVELLRAQRYGRSAALMLVDLDGFKGINDELGHQAGDHVLRRFADLLAGTYRNTDVISRYGGDEFAVIFPETTTEASAKLAQRVRVLLQDAFPDSIIPRPVTASFGVAAYPEDASAAYELVAAADRALYAAKMGGRDMVVAAGIEEEPRP